MEQTVGGAGPALAAHSKDGAAPGQTPASNATATEHPSSGAAAAGSSSSAASHSQSAAGTTDGMGGMMGQAKDAAGRVGESIAGTAEWARQGVSHQGGRAADQIGTFVREQPFTALAITGVVCLALGALLGRR
ncbi:MAG: hypothetical protein AB7F35_12675 [Acetobacteraceae bacterium]